MYYVAGRIELISNKSAGAMILQLIRACDMHQLVRVIVFEIYTCACTFYKLVPLRLYRVYGELSGRKSANFLSPMVHQMWI